jgi:hypothetical protein
VTVSAGQGCSTHSGFRNPFRKALSALVPGLLASVLLLGAGPAPGASQEEPTLEELELEYRSALSAYEAARRAREAREIRFDRALEAADSARASGNTDELDRAFAEAQREARELGALDRRVEETAEQLRQARQVLLEALQDRLEALLEEVDSARDPEEREELAAILWDINNRYLELQATEDPPVEPEAMEEITITPRDTPANLRRKADLLDFQGDQYEAQIAEIDRRMERLEAAQRTNRAVQDFVAGIERYDDNRLPVVPPGSRTMGTTDPEEAPPAGDSVSSPDRPMTLEERIQSLQVLRDRLVTYLEQVRDKAERFRREAGGGGWE